MTAAAERRRVALPHERNADGTVTIRAFEGAILSRVLPAPAGRAFNFEVIFFPNHPRLRQLPSKPPEHFHPLQEEYVSVSEGALAVEVEGIEHILRPGDPEFVLQRGVNHRLYPAPQNEKESQNDKSRKVSCLLSAEGTSSLFALDLVFFENWYTYQEQVVVHGAKLNLIQVMAMFDAGDSYLTLPWYIPMRSLMSRVMGIVFGRWIGSLLGYQPFYKEWTTDWDLACEKMETCMLQRRFSDRKKVA
ncbi:uncharacterized protein LY89DRAFT_577667 [Mollisia scopiformis]|uniref:Uncharacterized protein n=1 Tax=Mollisia scopiformis TaxID=149040 RepID=A0A194XNU3_MOLSC|nr:uncharacterized protein LY89DRAFT_577667 [Mollisia scopiformis]KUJ21402.1 hypothetical protein LY89DRAFT_577667 [Mollisia scopiformis]